jgi:acyl-coenzyme A thioesterase PaaI-like protein
VTGHPAVAGREPELADLAAAVRRLVDLAVTSAPDAAATRQAADEINRLSDRLAAHRPAEPVTHSMRSPEDRAPGLEAMATRMPFDYIVGRFNPLALPIAISSEGRTAVGRGSFTHPYEGPPGCVHGAALAGVFDIVFTAANLLADAAGPTISLSVRYEKPTLLHDECVFEAVVDRTEGLRTFTTGRLVQNGVVTVEAEGVFAALSTEVIKRLGERRRRTTG